MIDLESILSRFDLLGFDGATDREQGIDTEVLSAML